jgi:hypothetical protein
MTQHISSTPTLGRVCQTHCVFDAPLVAGFRCHHVARIDPETFIHGPNTAGANAAGAL